MGAKNESEGLKINLAGYNEDKNKSPSEMMLVAYPNKI
jgi:hypothetical protein